MATSIQQFAKDNGYRIHQAKSIVKKVLGNLPDMLSDDDLTQIATYEEPNTESKALPTSEPLKQLPASEQSEPTQTAITNTEPAQLVQESSNTEESHLTTLERIEQVTSDLQILSLNQQLDNDYNRLVNTFKNHDKRKEEFLLNRLQSTYQSVQSHKPVDRLDTTAHTSRIDEMMVKIEALGIDTKSR